MAVTTIRDKWLLPDVNTTKCPITQAVLKSWETERKKNPSSWTGIPKLFLFWFIICQLQESLSITVSGWNLTYQEGTRFQKTTSNNIAEDSAFLFFRTTWNNLWENCIALWWWHFSFSLGSVQQKKPPSQKWVGKFADIFCIASTPSCWDIFC